MKNKKRQVNGAHNLVRVCLAPGCKRLTLRGLCGPCLTAEELRRIFSSIDVQDRH
jgi:hypothetical protein